MNAGIVAYGAYVPLYRITVEEIARVWDKDGKHVSEGLNVKEKAVAGLDEDAATIAVEAARNAVFDFGIDTKKIGALYVGSESHPYAVKTTSSIVLQALDAGTECMAADLEFACKAGTAGIQMCLGLVKSGMIDYGMAIGADTAQGRPNDALEFTAASGGAAFVIGKNRREIIAEINHTTSFTTDTPDFWRKQHEEFPMHGGRFTGEPAYFKHVISATKLLMDKAKRKPKDYEHVVFHQPNGKFPLRAGKILGFTDKQMELGLLTPIIGNTYSGASMLGLAAVLDKAKAGERVLVTSFGSGAGSDSFDLTITNNIGKRRAKVKLRDAIQEKVYIDYAVYAKKRRKLKAVDN